MAIYLLMQVIKLTLLAILMPVFSLDTPIGARIDLNLVILPTLASLLDIVGLYHILSDRKLMATVHDQSLKVKTIGLGWALAELITLHLSSIISQQALEETVHTQYFVTAAISNFDLLVTLSTVWLVNSLIRA